MRVLEAEGVTHCQPVKVARVAELLLSDLSLIWGQPDHTAACPSAPDHPLGSLVLELPSIPEPRPHVGVKGSCHLGDVHSQPLELLDQVALVVSVVPRFCPRLAIGFCQQGPLGPHSFCSGQDRILSSTDLFWTALFLRGGFGRRRRSFCMHMGLTEL